jgi:ABC-type multidrug transport system fused ATPase/permease subunit
MARINLTITVLIFLPLLVVVALSRLVWGRMLCYRRARSMADSAAAGFLGEIFGAVQAVKVASAEEDAIAYLHTLNETRRHATLTDRLFRGVLDSIYPFAVDFGVGVTLLLAGRAMTGGTFSVGDLALFLNYLAFAAGLPSLLGTFIGDYAQQAVAIERLLELVRPQPASVLIAHGPIYERGELPPVPFTPRTAAHRLLQLDVRGVPARGSRTSASASPAARSPSSPDGSAPGRRRCCARCLGFCRPRLARFAGTASRSRIRPASSDRRALPTPHRCRGCSVSRCATTSSWACRPIRWTWLERCTWR